MTGWIKQNQLKTLSLVLGIVMSMAFLISLLPDPVDSIANRVYEDKRPVMLEELDRALAMQKLRQEPRMQAIESDIGNIKTEQTEQKKLMEDNMAISREILEEVKK